MQEKIYLDKEFDKFMRKINSGENFTFLRFADGERGLMHNSGFISQEGWISPGRDTSLADALKDALQLKGENVYYAISCPCCDREAYYWYMTRVPSRKNVTFSNIFINSNYKRFLKEFPLIKRDAIVIANYRGQNNPIGSLNVLKYYSVGDQCVDFWEHEAQDMIARIINDFGDRNNLLYAVSAGPLTEPIIAALYRHNPNNCYVDFGSSIDIYVHRKDTRPYNQPGNKYARRNCWMFDPVATNFDVSVVLSAYKKPEALSVQLEAIENQTLKPREIYLFQDGIDGDYAINFKPEILSRFTGTCINTSNKGVWERFRFAGSAKSEYVCIFDDDTIPGKRWLENCHYSSQLQEGIYGTIGIIVRDPQHYPKKCWRTGWRRPYGKTSRVDFVGHSWFLRREYLGWMFDGTEKYQGFKYTGEDMCLSFKAMQHGIKTFVPPHPFYDTELWGSDPEYGMKYGDDYNAVSMNDENIKAMSDAMKMFSSDGWQFCINEGYSDSLRVYLGSKLGYYMKKVKDRVKA